MRAEKQVALHLSGLVKVAMQPVYNVLENVKMQIDVGLGGVGIATILLSLVVASTHQYAENLQKYHYR